MWRFKGNGYTVGRNGTTIPEWKIKDRIQIKDGAILSKYVNGEMVEQYKYSKELKRWIKQWNTQSLESMLDIKEWI